MWINKNVFKKYDMIHLFQRNSQGLTSDTWNLKFPALSTTKIMVPSYSEQQQISNLFAKLDDTITLHQRELETLNQTKKAFLQKMFI